MSQRSRSVTYWKGVVPSCTSSMMRTTECGASPMAVKVQMPTIALYSASIACWVWTHPSLNLPIFHSGGERGEMM